MPRKLTLEKVINICSQKNIEFLDNTYINMRHKHTLKCKKCNYVWRTRLDHITSSESGCPDCASEKYTLEEVKQLWKDYNFEYLDNIYMNNWMPMSTKCLKCNFIYKKALMDVKQGKKCFNCNGKIKKTIEDAKILWFKNNLEYLDNFYVNSQTPMNTKCKICNHTWKISYSNVQNRKNCPKCKNVLKYTVEKTTEIFKKSNLLFLDTFYKDVKTKYNTQCLLCHYTFKISLDSVLHNQSCPKHSYSKTEKMCIEIIEKFLQIKTSKKTIEINRDFQKKCTVDAHFNLNNIDFIVEINGEQHYKPVCFGSITKEQAQKKFEKQQKRDEWLRKYCKANNIILIEIDARNSNLKNIKTYIENILSEKI